jgi:transketolase
MQAQEYRDEVLPPAVSTRVAVEAGSEAGWERYIGNDGRGSILGMRDFGASAPLAAIMQEYGFTVENLIAIAKKTIERSRRGK